MKFKWNELPLGCLTLKQCRREAILTSLHKKNSKNVSLEFFFLFPFLLSFSCLFFSFLFFFFFFSFETGVSLCCPGWSAVAWSHFTCLASGSSNLSLSVADYIPCHHAAATLRLVRWGFPSCLASLELLSSGDLPVGLSKVPWDLQVWKLTKLLFFKIITIFACRKGEVRN